MHEWSSVQALIQRVQALREREGGGRIVRVTVRLGPQAALSRGHLREAFTLAASGTAVEGARLRIRRLSRDPDENGGDLILEAVELEEGR